MPTNDFRTVHNFDKIDLDPKTVTMAENVIDLVNGRYDIDLACDIVFGEYDLRDELSRAIALMAEAGVIQFHPSVVAWYDGHSSDTTSTPVLDGDKAE